MTAYTNHLYRIMGYLKEYPLKELDDSFKEICYKHCKIKKLPSDTFDNYSIDNYPAIPETREDIKELRKTKENITRELNYINCFISAILIYDSQNLNHYLNSEEFKPIINNLKISDNVLKANTKFDINKWEKEHKLLNKYLAIRNILKGVY